MISVTDSGVGIPPTELSKVFEPFTQVRGSAHLAHEGTGLGLPLSKKLIELHGGRIDLESQVGVGTKVTFRLPHERIVRDDASSNLWRRPQRRAHRPRRRAPDAAGEHA